LIHGPFHPSLWSNLIIDLGEDYEWFVDTDIWEGDIPKWNVKYQAYTPDIIPDVQIICLHQPNMYKFGYFAEMLKKFPYPIVFLEFWKIKCGIPAMRVKYPLIYTSMTSHNDEYENTKFSYPLPSPYVWDGTWKGDEKKLLVIHKGECDKLLSDIQKWNLPLEVIDNKLRNIPFNEWKAKFVHNRALIELEIKHSSTSLLEARMMKMPSLAFDYGDANMMTYAFSEADWKLKMMLKELLVNDELCKNWYNHFPLEVPQTKDVFGPAFQDAIRLCKNAKEPFLLGNHRENP